MQPIKDLLPENPKAITPESAESSRKTSKISLDEELVVRIFAYMQAKYTHKWSSQIPDDGMYELMKKCWAEDLATVPREFIKQALSLCSKEYPEWPPTVGQFKQLCNVGRDPILIPPERQLEKPRDEKLALDSLAEMKKILGVKDEDVSM